MINGRIFSGLSILVTGHTGFKGTWLVHYLNRVGARVYGFSLPLSNENQFFMDSNAEEKMQQSFFGDIRQAQEIEELIQRISPDYVFHLAAQPIVARSYLDPLQTISTNVIGTTNLLISALRTTNVKGVTLAATDKVYLGELNSNSFKETDTLGGRDPYSASKAAAEIISESLHISCNPTNKPVSSIRAGNVIGGGDIGAYRLIPDILRSIENNEVIAVRNLDATRPFQYITDAISGYLLCAQSHLDKKNTSEFTSYNIGPSISISVERVLQIFSEYFNMSISTKSDKPKFFETSRLSLNADHARNKLGWQLKYSPEEAVRMTAEWHKAIKSGTNLEVLISKTLSENLLY